MFIPFAWGAQRCQRGHCNTRAEKCPTRAFGQGTGREEQGIKLVLAEKLLSPQLDATPKATL